MDHGDLDWARAADAVNQRMLELHVSQRRLAGIADVSAITLRRLQHGDGGRRRTLPLVKLSAALGWGHDGIIRIARGEDPRVIEAEVEAEDRLDVVGIVVDIRDQLERIGERLSRLEQRQIAVPPQRRGA